MWMQNYWEICISNLQSVGNTGLKPYVDNKKSHKKW